MRISRPHVLAEDISKINYQKLKGLGMEKVIFDKDNTLVLHGENNFYKPEIKSSF